MDRRTKFEGLVTGSFTEEEKQMIFEMDEQGAECADIAKKLLRKESSVKGFLYRFRNEKLRKAKEKSNRKEKDQLLEEVKRLVIKKRELRLCKMCKKSTYNDEPICWFCRMVSLNGRV